MRVGLFLRNLDEEYQINLYHGIRARARALGINLICVQGETVETNGTQGTAPFGLAREIWLDGLLILSSVIFDSGNSYRISTIPGLPPSVPSVSLGLRIPGIPSVTIRSDRSLTRVIDHLVLDHGYRRFLFLGGPLAHQDNQIREKVFRTALGRFAKIWPEISWTIDHGGFSESSGRNIFRKYLNGPPFDAVVTANDNMAIGIQKLLRFHPNPAWRRCAITGFDDVPQAALVDPPLTSVHQPLNVMGAKGLDVLVRLIRGGEVPLVLKIPSQPVFRESCGCDHSLVQPTHPVLPKNFTNLETEFQDIRHASLESGQWLRDGNNFGRDLGAILSTDAMIDRLEGFLENLEIRDFFLLVEGSLLYERLDGVRTSLPQGGLLIDVEAIIDKRAPREGTQSDLCILDLKSDDRSWGLAIYSVNERSLPHISAALPHLAHALRRIRSLAEQKDRNRLLEEMVQARTSELARANEWLQSEVEARKAAEAEVIQISEFERQRFGLELHDDICQRLAGLSIYLRGYLKNSSGDPGPILTRMANQLEETLQLTRQYAYRTYPIELESRGLDLVLTSLCETVTHQHRCPCRYVSTLSRLPGPIHGLPALNLYRIVQEALHNAVKHSQATRIEVSAEVTSSELVLSIGDNGLGLPPVQGGSQGLGFRSMAYRASQLKALFELNSRPGMGTVIRVAVPRLSLDELSLVSAKEC